MTTLFFTGCATFDCPLEKTLPVSQLPLHHASDSADISRSNWSMSGLCVRRLSFKEGKHTWRLLLVTNMEHPHGPFWFLPHDNENTAFDAAVYAVKTYGGGFLSVESNGQRFSQGKDPNRHFKPGTIYTQTILGIIDAYKPGTLPYLTLHSNKEGHVKLGGEGTISMRVCSNHILTCPAGDIECGQNRGIRDEDCLVYLAGEKVDKKEIRTLNDMGMHVKFETVNKQRYDNSLSNYIALYRPDSKYFNIETEEGDLSTQKKMIDRVIKSIYTP